MALNDAIMCSKGELLFIMDADAVPHYNVLRAMVPHFRSARVAGVAGNPRVRMTRIFCADCRLSNSARHWTHATGPAHLGSRDVRFRSCRNVPEVSAH
jgi:cellulose synthase/poly-beta-1,6-N-acetylglucosamine synthase-like glycosyltransferase